MKGDEVESRAGRARGIVLSMSTVLKKKTQEIFRLVVSRAGAVRTTNARSRYRTTDCVGGNVMQLEVVFGSPVPIENVRLVPDLP